MKIKTFSFIAGERFDIAVNDFIKDKEVLDLKITFNPSNSQVIVLIMYNDNPEKAVGKK